MNSKCTQEMTSFIVMDVLERAHELERQGSHIIHLEVGEPDFDTPEHIKEAARVAIAAGKTKYTAVDGTPGLKQAVIDKFRRDNGFEFTPEQVLVSCGGKQSFFNLAQALLNPGDEVIIPTPYWVSYPEMVGLLGGRPRIIPTDASTGFKITPDMLRRAITPKSSAIILNTPSNPSGMLYSREELV